MSKDDYLELIDTVAYLLAEGIIPLKLAMSTVCDIADIAEDIEVYERAICFFHAVSEAIKTVSPS